MSTKGNSSSPRWMAVGGRPVIVMAFPPGEAFSAGDDEKELSSTLQTRSSAGRGASDLVVAPSNFAVDRDGVVGPGREGDAVPGAPALHQLQAGGRGQIIEGLSRETILAQRKTGDEQS